MKAIHLRRPFDDGYIEIAYHNPRMCQWEQFHPDPRKKKHRKPKFRRGECAYGAPHILAGDIHMLVGVSAGWRLWAENRQKVIREMLTEAAQRYDDRRLRSQ